MKKIVFMALIGLLAAGPLQAQDIVTQDIKQLPPKSQKLITDYFSAEKISYIKIDEEWLSKDYEVTFVSGNEIEFSKNGDWHEINCKRSAVPEALVPGNILAYVKKNFSGTSIAKIEKKSNHYEVELSNDLDMEFDLSGNFLRLDD